MQQNRRDFLKGAFWMGAAAVAAHGMAENVRIAGTGMMTTYHDKPLRNLRVGVVGLGRGQAGISGFTLVPGGYIAAICDINAARRERTLKYLADKKAPTPKIYGDKGDLIYNSTPWQLHVPIALYAMEHGKHVVTEVPSAFTVEECWKLVETSERTQRHCMQLENCCYGENEMLAFNLVHLGLLGEISHGEGAYIHDLRTSNYNKWNEETGSGGYWDYWRLRHNAVHGGNQYPTHGLGPICLDMDINRGDRFDFLVSVDSKQAGFEEVGKGLHSDDPWRSGLKVKMGDMNTSIIKTVMGRTIMVQHNVGTAHPYSRLNLIQGTRGVLQDYPLRIAIEESLGKGVHAFDEKKTQEIRQKYKHPLWKTRDEIAKRMPVTGHGGMDFLMILRLSYCLQNGLPLDMNVYDLASWCCLCELTEKSADNRGRSMDIPDFTRGGWKTAPKLGLVDVDLAKMNFQA